MISFREDLETVTWRKQVAVIVMVWTGVPAMTSPKAQSVSWATLEREHAPLFDTPSYRRADSNRRKVPVADFFAPGVWAWCGGL